MKVVILAGGFGTRISEESNLRPKPMVEIGGLPILWHILKYYSSFGFNEFIICCGHMGYTIKEYFADYYLHRSDVTFDFSDDNKMIVHSHVAEPWKVTLVDTGLNTQTGGRIRKIKKYVGAKRFFMTYGDGLSDINLNALLSTHEKSGMTLTLSAVQPGSKFGMLDVNDRDGTITGFREKAKEDGNWINAGFMVIEPEVFDFIPGGEHTIFERAPMDSLSKAGKLGVYKHHGFWQCMDTLRDRSVLERLWNGGNAPWKTWK